MAIVHMHPAEPTEPRVVEAGLVQRARDGDRDAFAALHARYCRVVHAILIARVPAQHADDLVQDVFLAALAKLGGLHDDHRFGAWICTIARNRATDFHRTRRNVVELPEYLGRQDAPRAEAAEALRAIQSLPSAYAETLAMRLVEGLTGPEIAARTGMTPGSVRVNLSRGMRKLRDALGMEGS